jgi:hypothetical protein
MDCAGDSARALGGLPGGLSGGDKVSVRLVGLAATTPGARRALSLPASSGSPMT